MIGALLSSRGDTAGAMQAFERCLAASPAATDCVARAALLDGYEGRCEQMEQRLRRVLAGTHDVEDHGNVFLRAIAVHATGRPRESVVEVMRQRWTKAPWIKAHDQARLALASGDFATAERELVEGSATLTTDPNASPHLVLGELQIALAEEMGLDMTAAELSDQLLKRSDAWVGSDVFKDPTVWMLRTMLRAKTISEPTFLARRAEWSRRVEAMLAGDGLGHLWLLRDARGVQDPAEARAAMASWDGAGKPSMFANDVFDNAELGRVALLAGRIDHALPLLQRLASSCMELRDPIRFTQNLAHLGEALEAKGRTGDACTAYGRVIRRWGNAATSRTAERVKTRIAALGCNHE